MTIAEIPSTVTPEELLRMPDNSTMELVNGRIVEKHVSVTSSDVEGNFYFLISAFLRSIRNPIAKAFPASLGYQCFADAPLKVRKADTTVVLINRLKELADPDPGYMPIIPDLAVEVISPNDLVYDVDDKVQEYLDAGFPLVWIANPNARTIMVYPGKGHPVIYIAGDEMTAEAVLPGFRCKVDDFFPPLAAPEKR